MRFTSPDDVAEFADIIANYVEEAIEVEAAGLKVPPAVELVLVEELRHRLDHDPLRAAFEALTPGRQREYNVHFAGAKHAKTREARVDKCVEKILDAKGLRDIHRDMSVRPAAP